MHNKKKNWEDLKLRLFSALFLIAIAVCGIIVGGWGFLLMLALLSLLMMWEWLGLYRMPFYSFSSVVGMCWPLLALVSAFYGYWYQSLVILAMGWVVGARLWMGSFLVGLASLSLLWLRVQPEFGLKNVLFLVCIVATSDSAAYMGGRMFGGKLLAPAISPAKTVSGALCALCAAFIGGGVLYLLLYNNASVQWGCLALYAVCAAAIGVSTQLGDLGESALKRACGVKDSSSLIPGHGGFLDRFDGYLVAAPVSVIVFMFLH